MSDPSSSLQSQVVPPATSTPIDAPASGQIPLTGRRSPIPKVVGILAIIFASIGLLVALGVTFGMGEEMAKHGLEMDDLGSYATWVWWYMGLSVVTFILHLGGGIICLMYKRRGPLVLTLYGSLALALLVADCVISWNTFPFPSYAPEFEIASVRLGLALFALPWPITALVLINQPTARHSCQR